MNYDRIVRGIRRHPDLYSEDEYISEMASRVLDMALKMQSKRRQTRRATVGPYSGLTRLELAQSGTCEPDWF